MSLRFDVGFACLALCVERIEFLIEAFFVAFVRINRAATLGGFAAHAPNPFFLELGVNPKNRFPLQDDPVIARATARLHRNDQPRRWRPTQPSC